MQVSAASDSGSKSHAPPPPPPQFLSYSQHTHKRLLLWRVHYQLLTINHTQTALERVEVLVLGSGDFLKWSLSSNSYIFSFFFGPFLFLEAMASNPALSNYWVWAARTGCQTESVSCRWKSWYDSTLSHLFRGLLAGFAGKVYIYL